MLVGISLLKIASLSLYVSRLPLIMTGSYFIILGSELYGLKGRMCRQSLLAALPASSRTRNQSLCPPEGSWVGVGVGSGQVTQSGQMSGD